MAQTIKHRRGPVEAVNNIAGFANGEIIVASGSVGNIANDTFVYVGRPGPNDNAYAPISKIYMGNGAPIDFNTLNSSHGTTLNGLPYYDYTHDRFYVLNNAGHTELTLTSSAITNFATEVSAAAAAAGFGSTPEIDLSGLATFGDNVFTGSQVITGSDLLPAGYGSTTDISPASATSENYALVVSQSSWSWNHNAGHPNSLPWQSYLDNTIFNQYDANTDIAEILRTIVGLISASTPALVENPSPEPTQYAGSNVEYDSSLPSDATSTWTNAYIPTSFTDTTLSYLDTKGFNDGAGDTPFGNVASAIYQTTNDDLGLTIESEPGTDGNTFFDAGPKDKYFTVFAIASQSFSDNQSITIPSAASNTFTTQSLHRYGQNGAGTSNTIVVETIPTDAPTVIPPVYQKARFSAIPLITDRRYAASGENFSAKESTGYYRYHDIKVGITTGSSGIGNISDVIGGSLTNATVLELSTTSRFMTPIQASTFAPAAVSITTPQLTALTATSRSLSGAPYLNSATWNVYNVTASGLFDPLFYGGSFNIGELSMGSVDVTNLSLDFDSTSDVYARADGGTVDTARQNIYNGNTELSVGSVPYEDSTVRFDANLGFDINDATNAASSATEAGVSDSTFFITATARKWNNTTETANSANTNYHTAGDFGQDATSGSMLIYATSDGYDSGTTTIEYFKGESHRRTIGGADNAGLTTLWDSGSRLTLGNGGDLQVKPGFLVNPEHNGTDVSGAGKGYWYPTSGFDSSHYKWYLREFNTGATSNKGTLTLNFDPNVSTDFVTLDSTTANKIAIGVIFERQLPENGSGDSNTIIFDAVKGNVSYGGSLNGQSTSNQLNPFTDTVDVVGDFATFNNTTGSLALGLNNSVNQTINNTYRKIWVLIRYTGAPANTLTNLTVTAS